MKQVAGATSGKADYPVGVTRFLLNSRLELLHFCRVIRFYQKGEAKGRKKEKSEAMKNKGR